MKTKHRRDSGFSLTALIFFATAVSIAIAAIVPAYQMQAKRELEAELIFRGGEYTRAIQKYHNKFGVWPTSIDQLVSTNNMRFIRCAYKDPLTGKDFRLITLNPNGSVNGSKLYMQSQNIGNNQSMFGNNVQQGGQGQTNIQQQPNNNTNGPANGPQNNTPGLGNTSGFGNNSLGGSPGQTPGGNNNTSAFTNSMGGQQNQTGQSNPAAGGGAFRVGGGTNPPQLGGPGGSGGSGQTNPFSASSNSFGGGGTPVAGGGIIGIASDDEKDSIMVYNNRQKYDEWEFYAILGQQGQQPNGQQNPQQNQQRNPAPGSPGQTNPFGNTSTQPFGGPPTNPLGGGGQNTTTGPFGFGGNQPMPNTPGKLP